MKMEIEVELARKLVLYILHGSVPKNMTVSDASQLAQELIDAGNHGKPDPSPEDGN